MRAIFILTVLLLPFAWAKAQVIPEPCTREGEEFSVEAKRCIPAFGGLPCESGSARFLGACAEMTYLRMNENYEVSEDVRNEVLRQVRAGRERGFLSRYQVYVAREVLRLSTEAQSATQTQTDPPAEPVAVVAAPQETRTPAPAEAPTSSDNQDQLEENFQVFNPDDCEWVPDMPRKIHAAPGCRTGRSSQMCVGYVSCSLREGEGRFIRASTCHPRHCGDEGASDCTKDPGFWSTPDESSPKYLGREIRSLIHRARAQ